MVRDLNAADTPATLAAGAALWRVREQRLEVCVIHRPKYDDWTLPKGKLDRGEHVLAAAVREVEEETGQRITLGRPLPATRYPTRAGPKEVRYWAARADDTAPAWASTDEVDEVAFLPVADAIARLSHGHDAEIVDALASGPLETTPLVLLRHAKAIGRSSWGAPDRLRPLSARGVADARRLPPLLRALGLTRILSSDAVRCTDTVLPYARDRGLAIELEPLFSEDGFDESPLLAAEAVRKALSDQEPTVLCSHRPVLPALLAAAAERTTAEVPEAGLPTAGFHVLHHYGELVVDIETHQLDPVRAR